MSASRFIVIAGGSGSGKTELARRLQRTLGARAALLTLDHFYRDLGHLPAEHRELTNFDDPASIDWHAVNEVMTSLSAGMPAAIPQYDFTSHTRLLETDQLDPAPLVILEGLWPLTHPSIRNSAAVSVFIDCPADLRLARRIARDTAQRGRSEESVRRQFIEHVEPMHEIHVQPQLADADFVFGPYSGDAEIATIINHLALATA